MNTKPAAHAGHVTLRPYPTAQVLSETREEIRLLTDPATCAATAARFGLGSHLIAPYVDTLRAQERNLSARLASESAYIAVSTTHPRTGASVVSIAGRDVCQRATRSSVWRLIPSGQSLGRKGVRLMRCQVTRFGQPVSVTQ